MKFASLFSGFGGADIGARAAGLDLAWGVEYVPEIAAVANANLDEHVRVADILDLDPSTFERVDVLHASPPCPNFSVAKAGGEETPHDLAMAQKVAEFVTTLRPQVFTLENVWGYRNSQSWAVIRDALYGAGYWLNVEHVNAANFGVPQTRKRMIVRAVLGGWVPYLPAPVPWVGWYAAIEDLLPTLPESKLAPWQLARLPDDLRASVLFSNGGYDGAVQTAHVESPAMTVAANSGPYNSWLINESSTMEVRAAAEPAAAQIASHRTANQRAILVDGKLNSNSTSLTSRDGEMPSFTVTTSHNQKDVRGVLVEMNNTARDARTLSPSLQAMTVTASIGSRPSHMPFVVSSRVVAMTPRCLARFQSFPDWYELPEKKTLAARGIGNAVPPLLYQRIVEGLVSPH